MTLRKLLLSIALALTTATAYSEPDNYGKYVGTVQTEWLEDGRRMRLLAAFSYFDPAGQEWQAPNGWVVDGASIPKIAWSVIGGPFEGRYRNASVIHDVSCDKKEKAWEAVHEVFYWAMLASGVEKWRAKVMYAAVYHFGPRWPRVVTIKGEERSKGTLARQRALAQAERGSSAKIVEIHPYGQKADFEILIIPPPRKLVEADFDLLALRIKQGEPRQDRAMRMEPEGPPRYKEYTLEDIREYRSDEPVLLK
jgi:hypothetical protein